MAEIAKYTVKESDLIIKDQDGVFDLDQTDENIRILDDALAFREINGLWRAAERNPPAFKVR